MNAAISAMTFLAAMTLAQPAAQWALRWSSAKPFGLAHLVSLPGWLEFGLSFLLMDLAFYYWHLANHRAPFLWRFHNVHHTDPELDVSTAFRFHFGEIALSSAFSVIQISLIGISPWAFAVYQLAFQSGGALSPQQPATPDPLRAALEQSAGHAAHARHSPLAGPSREQLEFRDAFSIVGPVPPLPGLNISQREIVIGIPGYCLPENNTGTERALDAVSKTARLLAPAQW